MPDLYGRHCLSLVLSGALLLAGAADAEDTPAEMDEIDTNEAEREVAEEAAGGAAADDVLTELIFGEPVDCINAQRIRNTKVLNDREIVFYMSGSDIYLNRLPHRCSGLRMADAFSYEVRTSQLCHIDLIRVVDNFGGSMRTGIACGLGRFLPITEEQLDILRERGPVEDRPADDSD